MSFSWPKDFFNSCATDMRSFVSASYERVSNGMQSTALKIIVMVPDVLMKNPFHEGITSVEKFLGLGFIQQVKSFPAYFVGFLKFCCILPVWFISWPLLSICWRLVTSKIFNYLNRAQIPELFDQLSPFKRSHLFARLSRSEQVDLFKRLDRSQSVDLFESFGLFKQFYFFQAVSQAQRVDLFESLGLFKQSCFEKLSRLEQVDLFKRLDRSQRVDLFESLAPSQRVDLFESLAPSRRVDLFESLVPSQRVDLFKRLNPLQCEDLLWGLLEFQCPGFVYTFDESRCCRLMLQILRKKQSLESFNDAFFSISPDLYEIFKGNQRLFFDDYLVGFQLKLLYRSLSHDKRRELYLGLTEPKRVQFFALLGSVQRRNLFCHCLEFEERLKLCLSLRQSLSSRHELIWKEYSRFWGDMWAGFQKEQRNEYTYEKLTPISLKDMGKTLDEIVCSIRQEPYNDENKDEQWVVVESKRGTQLHYHVFIYDSLVEWFTQYATNPVTRSFLQLSDAKRIVFPESQESQGTASEETSL